MPSALLRVGPSANVPVRIDGRRRGHRRAEPLHRAGRQQWGERSGETGGQRTSGEHREPGDEHVAPSEKVSSATAQQQEAAEDQSVGDHNPLQIR